MRRLLLGLPFIVLLSACGGGGQNPAPTPEPTIDDLPAYTQYPAYQAISAEDGSELYLQVRDDEGAFDGRYAFFIKEGETVVDIMDGPVEGAVDAEGMIHMTLRNPYDETSEPIEIEGFRDGANLVMADVENLADIQTFTPIAQPADSLTRDSLSIKFKITIDAIPNQFGVQEVTTSFFRGPIWLLPITFPGFSTSSSSQFSSFLPHPTSLTTWNNGWTQVSIGALKHQPLFSGWVNMHPAHLERISMAFSDASLRSEAGHFGYLPVTARVEPVRE